MKWLLLNINIKKERLNTVKYKERETSCIYTKIQRPKYLIIKKSQIISPPLKKQRNIITEYLNVLLKQNKKKKQFRRNLKDMTKAEQNLHNLK